MHDLGVTKFDDPSTVELAYDLQCACDTAHSPKWLGALEKIAEQPVKGKESLLVKVVTERSLEKYTEREFLARSLRFVLETERLENGITNSAEDVANAYVRIGYTQDHAEALSVEAEDAPDDYILDLHKKAMTASSTSEKPEISRALVLIGKSRNSELMQKLGHSGQTILSVDDAYQALSAPRDSIDDGLIM